MQAELLAAVCAGDAATVGRLLTEAGDASKALADTADEKGRTALMLASSRGDACTVRVLLEAAADIDQSVSGGITALMVACKKSHAEVAQMLLMGGANGNCQDSKGFTALMYAAQGSVDVAEVLLQHSHVNKDNVSCIDVNLRNYEGETAFILACSVLTENDSNAQIAQKLLAHPDTEVDEWNAAVVKFMMKQYPDKREARPARQSADPLKVMQETLHIMKNGWYAHPTTKERVALKPVSRARMIVPGRGGQSSQVGRGSIAEMQDRRCVRVVSQSSFSAASDAVSAGEQVMVLDFATDVCPGGGARHGKQQGTQEETLCRQSSLLSGLEQLSYPIAHDGCAVVEGVGVFRHDDYSLRDKPFYVTIVAASMPNLQGVGSSQKSEIVGRKLGGVLQVWLASNCNTLVLGAWGCGAFGNDAEEMAEIFRGVISAHLSGQGGSAGAADSRRIVFAIPGGGGESGRQRLRAFEGVFGA